MPEQNTKKKKKNQDREFHVRYRGRGSQIWIYLGKMLRMFVYQNDWKVLPMSALIAGLVGLVIRSKMFIDMEGTLMGAFALACVCIWNGCFNSIQVICRERDVIKREHRSGMHISSYVIAHMLYQLLICVLQTWVTLYVTKMTGVQYPKEGLFTSWLIVDLGISMLLITYASDMLSLWVSALARSSTTAMTIMPFILIFQLVFSGGMFSLPDWTEPLSNFTISNPALKVISAQSNLNNQPFVTISNMIDKMHDSEINVNISIGKLLDVLSDIDHPQLNEVMDVVNSMQEVEECRDESISINTTLGKVLDVVGEKEAKTYLEDNASAASYDPAYENSRGNILGYWFDLIFFAFIFAVFSVITLEFIDKDKR